MVERLLLLSLIFSKNPDADSAKLASRKVLKTPKRGYLIDAIVVQVA
jgi:hypothetical protein